MKYIKLIVLLFIAFAFSRVKAMAGQISLDPTFFNNTLANEDKPEPWHGVSTKTHTTSRYFMPTGFMFPARLESAVYSYNVESPAVAIIDRNVEYLKRVVLPAGTKAIGTVSVQQDHDRILVTFHTLVIPDTGDEVKFNGMALSLDGSAGIQGKVETHKDSAVANTVLRSLVSGTQSALLATGINPIAASAAQGFSSEATTALSDQREQITTSITVNADTGLRIYLPQRIEY